MNASKTVASKVKPRSTSFGSPLLTFNGGPLISSPDVINIYWGSYWSTAAAQSFISTIEAFVTFAISADPQSLITRLQEYYGGATGFTLTPGIHDQVVILTDDPPNPVDDVQIQQRLLSLISAGTVKPSTANTLYRFMFPSGTVITGNQIGIGSSCVDFCGYHNSIGTDQFGGPFYGVLPYQDCSGCFAIANDLIKSTTVVWWHEIAEALTDPVVGNGWVDNSTGNEIGDICEGTNEVVTQTTAGLALVSRKLVTATAPSYTSPGPSTDANGVSTGSGV